jgi:hypothetical protein
LSSPTTNLRYNVDLMLAQLGGALPRELTGRTRYRAWGIV